MRLPWVSRRRLYATEQKLRVARTDHAIRMAKAASEIRALTKDLQAAKDERDKWHREYVRWVDE